MKSLFLRSLTRLAIFGFLSLSLVGAPAFKAFADNGGSQAQIFVVDMQRVLDDSIVGKAARSDLQSELKKRESGISSKKGEIERLKADLQKQAAVLSESALMEKQEVIRKKERDLSTEVQGQREELGRKSDAQMKKVLAQIDIVLAEIAKERGNPIFVEKDPRLVLYSDPKLEVTSEVVKRLNEKKLNL
jgi:outer membrane protein